MNLKLPSEYFDADNNQWCVSLGRVPDPPIDWGTLESATPNAACPDMDFGDFTLPGCCDSAGNCGGGNGPIQGLYPPIDEDGTKPVQCITWEEMETMMSGIMPETHPATISCN